MTTYRFKSAPLLSVDGRPCAKRPLARTEAPPTFRDLHLSREEQIARIRQKARAARERIWARESREQGQEWLFGDPEEPRS